MFLILGHLGQGVSTYLLHYMEKAEISKPGLCDRDPTEQDTVCHPFLYIVEF